MRNEPTTTTRKEAENIEQGKGRERSPHYPYYTNQAKEK